MEDINEHLRRHPRWDGRSLVNVKAILVDQRDGVFSKNADALYYQSNFCMVSGTEASSDFIDLAKLRDLYFERYAALSTIFSDSAFDWVSSLIEPIERTALNEYICHEAGHRISFSVQDKQVSGFFRIEGRLAWPLIYVEEFRADVNSWEIASRALSPTDAAQVVLYTLMHRFGLAVQNLRDGRSGVGYVPFLHFAAMIDAGALILVQEEGHMVLDFSIYQPEEVLRAALEAAAVVDREINERDAPISPNQGVEAMLEYAVARLGRSALAKNFSSVFRR